MACAKQYEFDDFTWLPNLFFKTLGYDFLDLPKRKWLTWLLRCYACFCAGTHWYCVFHVVKRMYERETIGSDSKIIMSYAELVLFVIIGNVKFLTFLRNRERVRNLHDELQKIYPRTQEERLAYRANTYYWPIMTRVVFFMYYTVIAIMAIGPFVQSMVLYFIQMAQLGVANAQFPYLRGYPMEYSFKLTGFWSYALTEVLDIVFSQSNVHTNMGADLWVICLATQICMHFDFNARSLAAYEPSVEHESQDCAFLAAFVQRHQHLFRLQQDLDNAFGVLLVYNLLSNALILCCVAFFAILESEMYRALPYFLYLFIASAQFYIVCYYGQMLITKSEDVADAAYEQNWYNGSIKYKMLLLIVIMRSQKAAAISAGGFMATSLKTFQILMNITYRFFALIRQMLN